MLNNLIPGQKGANVKQPTTKRVLAAFKQIKAVRITLKQQTYAQVDQLNHTQKRILKLLKIPPDIYQKLGENLNLKQQE